MKPYRIVVLHWGAKPEYLKLLAQWVGSFPLDEPRTREHVCVLSDNSSPMPKFEMCERWPKILRVDPRDDIPSHLGYQFDYKGCLVCAALLAYPDPMLMVDADAIVRGDPTPLLEPFQDEAIAMPEDEGARGAFLRNTDGTNTNVAKRCAGVMWFGGAERPQLVHDYKRAFRSMRYGNYLEARRLAEQHAWSLVAHWHKAPMLPRELNWPEHFAAAGPNPDARIVHLIGKKKWATSAPSGAASPAPRG